MIEGDEEKVRFNWGVKSLPWLIFTDTNYIVQAEGIGIDELDERIKVLTDEHLIRDDLPRTHVDV